MPSIVQGQVPDPLRKYRFKVYSNTFLPRGRIGFTSVAGLRSEVEVTDYREGDHRQTRKLPGMDVNGTVTLKHGIDVDSHLYAWHRKVKQLPNSLYEASGAAVSSIKRFRDSVYIHMLDRIDDKPSRKVWKLTNAWPSTYEVDEMSTDGSDVLIETIELVHEGIDQDFPVFPGPRSTSV